MALLFLIWNIHEAIAFIEIYLERFFFLHNENSFLHKLSGCFFFCIGIAWFGKSYQAENKLPSPSLWIDLKSSDGQYAALREGKKKRLIALFVFSILCFVCVCYWFLSGKFYCLLRILIIFVSIKNVRISFAFSEKKIKRRKKNVWKENWNRLNFWWRFKSHMASFHEKKRKKHHHMLIKVRCISNCHQDRSAVCLFIMIYHCAYWSDEMLTAHCHSLAKTKSIFSKTNWTKTKQIVNMPSE